MKLGFIGLGIMGAPMAGHLIAGGHETYLQTRSEIPSQLIDAGGIARKTPRDVGEAADVIFLMVPDTPDVERVIFGEDGVAEGLTEGKTIVDMSSISPVATQDFARRVGEMGCAYVDAPVSGGEVGAKAASLTIMVGAAPGVFETIEPLFNLMGKNVTRIGDVGTGQITKVANQIIVALNIAAVSEALVFASKAGANPATVREALMGGFASSRILEVHGQRMIERTFDPGFRIKLHQKDLGLALESARSIGATLPQTANAAQLMQSAQAHGWDDLDHSALVKTLEELADHTLV